MKPHSRIRRYTKGGPQKHFEGSQKVTWDFRDLKGSFSTLKCVSEGFKFLSADLKSVSRGTRGFSGVP